MAATVPKIVLTSGNVHVAMNPMTIPDALFSSRSDSARVGISPNLLGVAMPPTCPRRVEIIAFLNDIFSIYLTAHCHFTASVSILQGINSRQSTKDIQLVEMFDTNWSNNVP